MVIVLLCCRRRRDDNNTTRCHLRVTTHKNRPRSKKKNNFAFHGTNLCIPSKHYKCPPCPADCTDGLDSSPHSIPTTGFTHDGIQQVIHRSSIRPPQFGSSLLPTGLNHMWTEHQPLVVVQQSSAVQSVPHRSKRQSQGLLRTIPQLLAISSKTFTSTAQRR